MARSPIIKTFTDQGISSSTILVPDELTPLFDGDRNQLPLSGTLRNQNIIPMEVSLVPPRLNRNQTRGRQAREILNLSALRREADVRNQIVNNTLSIADPLTKSRIEIQVKEVFDRQTGNVVGLEQVGIEGVEEFTNKDFSFQTDSNTVSEATSQRFSPKGSALVASAESLQRKIDLIQNMPSLVFLINPSQFEQAHNKKIDEQFARRGYVNEHWGEELSTLQFQGSIGATYVSGYGLTRFHRRDSASFKNLMHLFLIYRNNGYIYEDEEKRRISSVGAVRISYDSTEYLGSFDELTITENAEKPFNLTYSFGFTVRQRFDVSGG